jgi:beta-lactamase regulating signal transducer with metallopeptidase domain
MHTLLTYFVRVSVVALLFILFNRIAGLRVNAGARFMLGGILTIALLLPVGMPVMRFEIPQTEAEGFFAEAGEEAPGVLPAPPAEENQSGTQEPGASRTATSFPTGAVVIAIYALGAAVTLFCIFYQYCREVKALRRCGRAPNAQESEKFTALCRKHRLSKEPSLIVCPAIAAGSSLTFGFFRQTVLISDSFDEEDTSIILEHELTHCKRKDSLCKALLSLLTSIHWFNPIIHAFVREMNDLCEQSCDEKLLKNSGYEEKKRYCMLLIKTALSIPAEKKFMLSAFKGGKNFMKRRIENIIGKKSKFLTIVFAVIVLSILFLTSAIYITTPPENIKVAYFTEAQGLYDYNKGKTTIKDYISKNYYDIKCDYSADSDEVRISGVVNSEAFEVTGVFAGPSYNGARIAYIGEDSNENYNVEYIGFQFSQTMEYNELPIQDHDAGERARHKFTGWFDEYAKENKQYKNVLQLALNPVDTDDIIIIEIFLEGDFITEYITKNNIKCVDERIIYECEQWCTNWITAHNVKK